MKPYNWLILTIINKALQNRLQLYAAGKLLDIGCGEKPYEEMARPFVKEHIGLDHAGTLHKGTRVELWGTAYQIPLEDNSVDTVLCTDVLEHLEEPAEAVAEAFRVLKPGRHAIYTVPLFWHIHEEPRDFYRYTKFGLQHLFDKAGFSVVEIFPLTGFVVTFSQELVYFLYKFRLRRWNPLWWLIPPVATVIQAIAYVLNKIDPTTDFTAEYIAVAIKPVRP
jgi:ubiquinone/menaquinone biosynthesis C-methylase UbiE